MALNKSAAPVAEAPAAPSSTAAPATTPNPGTLAGAATLSAEQRRVRGQVRMHAIETGYRVGAALAATLGTSPASVRDELHKLAAEVADKIESYSFAE